MAKICISFRHAGKDYQAVADEADIFRVGMGFDDFDEVRILTNTTPAVSLTLHRLRTEWGGGPTLHFCTVQPNNIDHMSVFSQDVVDGRRRWAVLEVASQVAA